MISFLVNGLIIQRKRAEEALQESEEKWRNIFENNPTMYFMVDAAGTVLSVNPFGAEQLGYTVDELTGDSVLKVFHEADRAAAQRNTTRCIEQLGRAINWELRKVRKDGSVLWVRETAKAMLMKEYPVVLIVCEDITEGKWAEYLTAHVLESSPDGVGLIGRDYRYQRVNPALARFWRMPVERIGGKQVADLMGRERFEETSKPNLDRCFAGEEVTFSGWIPSPGSRHGRFYLAVSYSPLRPHSEQVEAALVITRDLTDHMLASEALRAAQADLAHVNRVATMGQLTASIAHEVNQPIAASVINAQAAMRWLGTDPPNLDEVREALGRAIDSARRAGDVISRIRAAVAKAPPRKSRFDFNEAVSDVIALTRSEARKHGVSVQARLAADLPSVEGDRVQLQQVILNLIMNAIEAMSGVDDGARELWLSTATDDEGCVRLAVRDSGPGLDPQSAARLFEAFYTTKPEGMGMGLAICRSIVEAHGGRLWASANEPRGAVFQLTLPLEQAEAAPAEQARQMPG
jgi:PAS domain S-box-containing protein